MKMADKNGEERMDEETAETADESDYHDALEVGGTSNFVQNS